MRPTVGWDRAYVRRGIPHDLILDPCKAHFVTLRNPASDGHPGRDTVPYGKTMPWTQGSAG